MAPSALHPYAVLVGRILYSLVFIVGGIEHFRDREAMTLMAADQGVPAPGAAVVLAGTLFVVGGVLVLFGWRSRLGATLLVATLVPVTLWMHRPLSDPGQVVQLLKNSALVGGGLLLMAHGAGPLSLDGALSPEPVEEIDPRT